MSRLVRLSPGQLSRLASPALRPASRLGFHAVRLPRPAARAGPVAFFSHQPRLCSAPKPEIPEPGQKPEPGREPEPVRAPGNDGSDESAATHRQSSSSTQPKPPKEPLPIFQHWVFLNEEELAQLPIMLDYLPRQARPAGLTIAATVESMKKNGVPPKLPIVIKNWKQNNGINFFDVPALTLSLREFRNGLVYYENWKAESKDAVNSKETGRDEVSKDNGEGQQAPREAGEEQQQKAREEGEDGHSPRQGEPNDPRDQKDGKDQKRDENSGGINLSLRGDNMTIFALAVVLNVMYFWYFDNPSREITWQEVCSKYLEKGLVEKFVVDGDRVRVQLNHEAARSVYGEDATQHNLYFSIGSVDGFERRLEKVQEQLGIPPSEHIPISYTHPGILGTLLVSFGPTLLLVGLLTYMSRGRGGGGGIGGAFGFGKSRAKRFNHESAVKVKFSDVAGMDEAKVEIVEFVSFLKTPDKFVKLGAKIPRGAILSGPPGTGKTLLAKATAGESGVPFFSVSGSEFVEMFVGVGASRVRDLFAEARKNAPCIIFIDEIDAIGKSRDSSGRFGGNDEREATLNQILTEMDGFNTQEQVVVLAGTNRPDILDKALMRPGRFDRHIHIDRPTMKGRSDIFRVHLANIHTLEDMDYLCGRLSALTPGFAGADIANVVNEAALVAARANASSVVMKHFEQAIERVIGGLERKSLVLSPEEKRTVAYHEAGHAVCGWYFEWADPLLKVSIIPRGQGALGYAQYLPAGDAYLMTVNQLMDRMAMTLGGRISEELHFPTVTTGASDDFKKVTQMATTMVTQWGMSDKLGPLHFNQDNQQVQKPFAESTAQTIDAEVRRIVDQAYKQCRDLLTDKKKEVGIVAEELLRKEELTRDDMVRLLGPRPFKDRDEFTKYFNNEHGGTVAPPPFPAEKEGPPPPPQEPPVDGPQPAMFKGDVHGRR